MFSLRENTSRKFLILLLFYLPVLLLQISSTFATIFADSHDLSCVHERASWYTLSSFVAWCRARWVGLARKICARCNTGSHVFPFFFICIFTPSLALSHMYVILIPSARSIRFGSRLWKVNDQYWNFSITICFKEPLLFITLFLEIMCFLSAIYFHWSWN